MSRKLKIISFIENVDDKYFKIELEKDGDKFCFFGEENLSYQEDDMVKEFLGTLSNKNKEMFSISFGINKPTHNDIKMGLFQAMSFA